MGSLALLYVALAKLTTDNTNNSQDVCPEDDEETNIIDKGDCVSGDSGQLNVINCIS
ncbi:hypothetical protein DPMN_173264 [Dreissena polymorpha]|uniref:Uncharacterized protein n=1 Tax=Dreissena polymorpha TaxID=45954 RepID=A0A9D4IFC1_DREPO|nr:hypothetical protein DPMN_173264 [Dreissena polymorpha]